MWSKDDSRTCFVNKLNCIDFINVFYNIQAQYLYFVYAWSKKAKKKKKQERLGENTFFLFSKSLFCRLKNIRRSQKLSLTIQQTHMYFILKHNIDNRS